MTTNMIAQVVAGAALPSGTVAEVLAVTHTSTPDALAGIAIIMVGIVAVAVGLIDKALRDTTEERQRLRAAEGAAQAEYTRLVAARSHLDTETERMLRLMESRERAFAREQIALRAELFADVQDREAALRMEGYLKALDHRDAGHFTLPRQGSDQDAQIINLPRA